MITQSKIPCPQKCSLFRNAYKMGKKGLIHTCYSLFGVGKIYPYTYTHTIESNVIIAFQNSLSKFRSQKIS